MFSTGGPICASVKIWENVLVSIQMLILSVMGVISMSRQFFQHPCRNGVQITWFWRWAQKRLFNFIFCRTFKIFHFGFDFSFLHCCNIWYFIHKFGTIIFNFMYTIFREMVTKSFYWCEFWQSRKLNSTKDVIYKGDAYCLNCLK